MPKAKYKKRPDGRWGTKVWDGTYKEDGRKNMIPVYSTKSSSDLEEKVFEIKRQVKDHTYTRSSDVTVGTYAWIWFNTYKTVRERNTQAMYKNIINKHLKDIENIKLTDLKKSDIQLLITDHKDSYRLCEQIKITISQIVKAAIDDQLLTEKAHRELCERLEMPKKHKSEKRILTDQEKSAIKKADFTPRERAFVYIIYGCGLRRGEALALTKADINLKTKTLTVNKAIGFDTNDHYDKTPKSNNGMRVIPMPDFLTNYLSTYLPTLPGIKLFTKLDGGDITKSSYIKMWASIVKKLNQAAGGKDNLNVVYGLTAHVFRHNYCTQLCYSGLSIKRVAELLGDSERMVMDVYSHVLEEKEKTEEKINEAIAL